MSTISPDQEKTIHQLIQALLNPVGRGECRCHWLDPNKIRVLAWKSLKDPQTLILKIADQKFIGLIRSDKNGELYWKFRDFYEAGDTPQKPTPVEPKQPISPQPEVSLPSSEVPQDNQAVEEFKKKYGTADSPKST